MEYEYFDKNGELVVALGQPIEDIIENDLIKDKRIFELEAGLENINFKLKNIESELELYNKSTTANLTKSLYLKLKEVEKELLLQPNYILTIEELENQLHLEQQKLKQENKRISILELSCKYKDKKFTKYRKLAEQKQEKIKETINKKIESENGTYRDSNTICHLKDILEIINKEEYNE